MISLTSPVKTPYHRLRAGLKVGALCLFTFAIYLDDSLAVHSVALAAVGSAYLIGGAEFARAGLRNLRPLVPFLVVISIWHLVTGTLHEGALIALKLIAVFGFANLVTMTTRLNDMIDLLNWLLTPLRRLGLNTRPLDISIAMVVRFTPALVHKGTLLAESWSARSTRRANWRLVAPFALLALDDAEHVAEALRARGGVG